MKTRSFGVTALTLGMAGSLSLGVFGTSADVAVSVGVQVNAVAEFHAPLAPHGVWVDVGHYGRCWRPTHVAVGWRPYCDGHWEWTDCGWYWVSDEPWSWACYHYGSWVFESGGWIWVPGVEWAPAWVYWRVGGGHIGWAPIAPRGVIVAPSSFVFVDGPRFHERIRPTTVIVNNTTIINKTTQITEVKRETRTIAGVRQNVVVNEGPGVEAVQKITGKQVAAVPVQEIDRKTSVPPAVKRRTLDSTTREAAPATQDQKKSTPERTPDQPTRTSPAEKPTKTDKPDQASPPGKADKPDRAPAGQKSAKPDRTPPEQPDKPDRTPPTEKPDKPDRSSPPDNPDKPDGAAPDTERRRPESPPQKSPGHSHGGEKGGKGKGKEKGPGD